MTRPLTLAAYRDLLAEVAEKYGGVVEGDVVRWYASDGRPLAVLSPMIFVDLTLRPALSVGASVILRADPDAAIRDLDAARDTLLRAIAARDDLAGVVVDVSRSAHPDPQEPR